MKKSMKVVAALVMSITLLVPSISTFAAEQSNEQSNNVNNTTVPVVSTNLPQNDTESCSSSQKIGIQKIPGDYTNGCKIVKTEKRDNVRWTNWENKMIPAIVGGGLGGAGFYIGSTLARAIALGAITQTYVTLPKSKPVYVTIQYRECKDMLGYHQYVIVKTYKDKKRTKFISSEMKKLS
ncbi:MULTISPECIES: hypothetical protein [Bacillus subtilis group]|uniref:hypothetical protein n=1 Tax=Bacillus subtilis group TaxID=653685 RepID=UPI0011AA6322|nr:MULTISPECIES: hypothetical protein [Bacillus subtilis group]EBG6512844.1 hypothetical protein [Salmonella enterica]